MDKLNFLSRMFFLASIAAWCFIMQSKLRKLESEVAHLDLVLSVLTHPPRPQRGIDEELSHVHVPVRDFFIIQHF